MGDFNIEGGLVVIVDGHRRAVGHEQARADIGGIGVVRGATDPAAVDVQGAAGVVDTAAFVIRVAAGDVAQLVRTVAIVVGTARVIDAAAVVGKAIAERALAAGITQVAFDRGGYLFHGRVKSLADAAREGGLAF